MTRSNDRALWAIGRCILSIMPLILGASLPLSKTIAGERQHTIVGWPEKGLGVSLDLSGFKVDIDHVKPDGRRYLMATNPTTGLIVSVTLEKVAGRASKDGCSTHLQRLRNQPPVSFGQDAKFVITGKMPILEYTFREFQGVRLEQKNVRACLAQENMYADLHLSKVNYTTSDESLFRSVLDNV